MVIGRVGSRICAIPVEDVEEVMRPLPVEPIAGMPSFLLGLSVIRGVPTPVVHAGILLGAGDAATPGRFLSLRIGERRVALAIDGALDVIDLRARPLAELPPLLRHADADLVAALGTLDSALLVVLESARLVPDAVWSALDAGRGR